MEWKVDLNILVPNPKVTARKEGGREPTHRTLVSSGAAVEVPLAGILFSRTLRMLVGLQDRVIKFPVVVAVGFVIAAAAIAIAAAANLMTANDDDAVN